MGTLHYPSNGIFKGPSPVGVEAFARPNTAKITMGDPKVNRYVDCVLAAKKVVTDREKMKFDKDNDQEARKNVRGGAKKNQGNQEELTIALAFIEQLQEASLKAELNLDEQVSEQDDDESGNNGGTTDGKRKKSMKEKEQQVMREPTFGFGPPARHLKMKIPGLDIKTGPEQVPVIQEYVPRWARGWHHEGWDVGTQVGNCFDNAPVFPKRAQTVPRKYPMNAAKQRAGVYQLTKGEMIRRDFGVENVELKVCSNYYNDDDWDHDHTTPPAFDIYGPRQRHTATIAPTARDATIKDPIPRGAKSVCEWQRDGGAKAGGQQESFKRDREERQAIENGREKKGVSHD